MSTRVGDRRPGKRPKLKVLSAAEDLKAYTLIKVKHFPKSTRWICAYSLLETARNIRSCVEHANVARLSITHPIDIQLRRENQIKALGYIADMYDLIEDAYTEKYIDGHCVDVWVGLVVDVENKLSSWMISDEKYIKEKDSNY